MVSRFATVAAGAKGIAGKEAWGTGIAHCAARLADRSTVLDSIQQAVLLYRRIGAVDTGVVVRAVPHQNRRLHV